MTHDEISVGLGHRPDRRTIWFVVRALARFEKG